ncbi:MAG: 2-dehydropantoate 2-reductase [Lachnospiraceae bacterium]|nr:2-dehydropantoate 2-reductase [Lachnospiraceae bacterium]
MIKNAAVIGAGAVGSYFIWGLCEKNPDCISLIAKGERKERLEKNGVIINDKNYFPPVKSPEEAAGVDLLIIAVKKNALDGILDDVKTIVKENTVVICPMNGIDSEEILSTVIPRKNIIWSLIKIASERNGNSIRFEPKTTLGVYYGERDTEEFTPRMQDIEEFFKDTGMHLNPCKDILKQIWYKFALNVGNNLPQAILGVGMGAYDDSEHVNFIYERLVEEAIAVAAANGVDISDRKGIVFSGRDKRARYSTLQDLDNKRHTEIEMFGGTMIEMGKKYNIAVPYATFCYHAIKALEEKNDGKFDYE